MLLFIGMNSCLINGLKGEGDIINKEIKVDSYNTIEHLTPAKVDLFLNDTNKVILTDYQNLIDYWDIKTVGNSLKLKTIPYTSFTKTTAIITLKKSGDLTKIILSGSGDFNIHNFFSSLNTFQIIGTGTIEQLKDIDLQVLNLKITGSGDINISGKTKKLVAELTGTGDMNLENLKINTAECNIEGTGSIFLQVSDTLKGSIKGTGNIQYKGNPVVMVSTTGTGKLIKN